MGRFGSTGSITINETEVDLSDLGRSLKNPEDVTVVLTKMGNHLANRAFSQGRAIGALVAQDHRTIQGCVVNLLLGILSGYADALPHMYQTDLRNEVAVALAHKVRDMVEAFGKQPYI